MSRRVFAVVLGLLLAVNAGSRQLITEFSGRGS